MLAVAGSVRRTPRWCPRWSEVWRCGRSSGAWCRRFCGRGHVVGRCQDVGSLLVQHQVVVAEMPAADVPVEVLVLSALDTALTASWSRSVGVSRAAAGLERGLSRVTLLLLTGASRCLGWEFAEIRTDGPTTREGTFRSANSVDAAEP